MVRRGWTGEGGRRDSPVFSNEAKTGVRSPRPIAAMRVIASGITTVGSRVVNLSSISTTVVPTGWPARAASSVPPRPRSRPASSHWPAETFVALANWRISPPTQSRFAPFASPSRSVSVSAVDGPKSDRSILAFGSNRWQAEEPSGCVRVPWVALRGPLAPIGTSDEFCSAKRLAPFQFWEVPETAANRLAFSTSPVPSCGISIAARADPANGISRGEFAAPGSLPAAAPS